MQRLAANKDLQGTCKASDAAKMIRQTPAYVSGICTCHERKTRGATRVTRFISTRQIKAQAGRVGSICGMRQSRNVYRCGTGGGTWDLEYPDLKWSLSRGRSLLRCARMYLLVPVGAHVSCTCLHSVEGTVVFKIRRCAVGWVYGTVYLSGTTDYTVFGSGDLVP